MSDRIWRRVVEACRGASLVMLTGDGETTLHPRFLSFMCQLDRLEVATAFSTNGVGIHRQWAERLAEIRHLRHVNVSIDSPDPGIYRHVRGGELERAIHGLRQLRAALRPSVDLTVTALVMASTLPGLVRLPELLADLGVERLNLGGMYDRSARLEHEYAWLLPDYSSGVQKIAEACAKHGVEVELVSEADPSSIQRLYYRQPSSDGETRQCTMPWERAYIDKDGLVFPCFSGDPTSVVGRLAETPFSEIWRGDRLRRFRASLLSGSPIPASCGRCTSKPLGTHPLFLFAARLIRAGGTDDGTGWWEMVFENTGAEAWTPANPVELRTFSHGQPAWRRAAGWIGEARVARSIEQIVQPGECGTFRFPITTCGAAPDLLQLFVCHGVDQIEGVWLPGTQVELT